MFEALGEAFKAQPIVLALLVLLVFGLIVLGCVYIAARYGPALVEKLAHRHENEHDTQDTGESLRTRVANELMTERLDMQRDLDQLKSDMVIQQSRFNLDFWNRQEDRGKRLHELANVVNSLRTAGELRQKEFDEMKRRLERLELEHQKTALDVVEIKTDMKYVKEKTDEGCRRLDRIEGPIHRIAAKLEVGSGNGGEEQKL